MNREIIFRGKPIGKGGMWLEGIGAYKTNTAEHLVIDAKEKSVEVVHLCQYIGLKDANGKKIFEGDILYQGQILLGVACISARYGLSVQTKTASWSLRNFVFDSDFDTGMLSDIEVVGNIHDNPELLKGENK